MPLYWVSFDTCAGLRQGKGVEVFVSGARYEGEFFRDLFNGHGMYTVPPITRAERLRAYVMRMIYEAEKSLCRADDLLDLGEPVSAAKPLAQAGEFYDKVCFECVANVLLICC